MPDASRPRGQSAIFVWMLAIAVCATWFTVAKTVYTHFSPPTPEPTHVTPAMLGLHRETLP